MVSLLLHGQGCRRRVSYPRSWHLDQPSNLIRYCETVISDASSIVTWLQGTCTDFDYRQEAIARMEHIPPAPTTRASPLFKEIHHSHSNPSRSSAPRAEGQGRRRCRGDSTYSLSVLDPPSMVVTDEFHRRVQERRWRTACRSSTTSSRRRTPARSRVPERDGLFVR